MTITVYTKPHCVQCNMTKKHLTDRGLAFDIVDVTTNPDALEAIVAKGFLAAPVVNAGDAWWSGFQPDKIDALQA